jgi:histidinol-phosphatase (PHP family)
LDELYDRFFETVINAAKSGLYDITGHVDNLKRMGYRPSNDMTHHYERVASVLKAMDMTVELNTSGYDYPAQESYPSLPFLTVLNKYRIPVSTGSDSHRPEHVGRHFEKAYHVLKEAGYDRIAYFEKRQRILKPLET